MSILKQLYARNKKRKIIALESIVVNFVVRLTIFLYIFLMISVFLIEETNQIEKKHAHNSQNVEL